VIKAHIVMGSKSDKKTVEDSKMLDILRDSGVDFDISICSAHRNPDELAEFCRAATDEGPAVFIGIAGMAAALPGALAGNTKMAMPVIGVPLDEDGIDSCLYMPPGVPVLTAGVGNAGLKNAAIAACQIVATADPAVAEKLSAYLAGSAKAAEFNIEL
jgi:5-(carboxyamino)imidazole ribonucleotide mutase